MTLALDMADCAPQLQTSIQLMRRVISSAGCGVLNDRYMAEWVRSHGVTVTAHSDDELDLLQYNGIRPVQIVFRCGPVKAFTRRAVRLVASRFIVGSSSQMAHLAEYAHCTKYIYLDDHSPLVLGDRRLKVIGLHSDVDDSGGAVEWASAAERLTAAPSATATVSRSRSTRAVA